MLTIPIYIRLLGVSEWGLVAACVSLQVLSNFLDIGFSQIVPRWAAREAERPHRLRQYFVLFRRAYWGLGLLMFVVMQASAAYLSHDWFQVPAERAEALELAIRIVSFQFFFQFVNNLHIGLWHGMQRQVLANVRTCIFGTLKHAVTFTVLIVGPPQAWLYALAFSVVALLEVSVNAFSLHRQNQPAGPVHPDEAVKLPPILKEVSVLSGGILVGLLVSQLDRIVLSHTVDVESFGVYTVVATLALAFLQLQAPITRAYFPVLVRDIQATGQVSVHHMQRLFVGTALGATLPALATCVLAPQVLTLWLHDPRVVAIGTDPLRLLLLAVAFNSIYGCIYQVIIASGQSKRVLQFNLISLASAMMVLSILGQSQGVLLGGAIWLAIALTQLTLGTAWFLHHRYQPNS